MDELNLNENSWEVETSDQIPEATKDPGAEPDSDGTGYYRTGKPVIKIVFIIAAVIIAAACAVVFFIKKNGNSGDGVLVTEESMSQFEEISRDDMRTDSSEPFSAKTEISMPIRNTVSSTAQGNNVSSAGQPTSAATTSLYVENGQSATESNTTSAPAREVGVYAQFGDVGNMSWFYLDCVIEKNKGQIIQDAELCVWSGDERSDAQYAYAYDDSDDNTEMTVLTRRFSVGAASGCEISIEYDVQYTYEYSAYIDGVEYSTTGTFTLEGWDESPD